MVYDCLIVEDEIELAQTTKDYLELFEIKTIICSSKEEFEAFQISFYLLS